MSMRALAVGLAIALAAVGCKKKKNPGPAKPEDQFDQKSVAVEVAAESALFWARAIGATELEVSARIASAEGSEPVVRVAPIDPGADHTARVKLSNLAPGARYSYNWTARDAAGATVHEGAGHFVVPASTSSTAPVRFAFSGDLGGQNVCIDAERDYPIFEQLNKLELHFFIGLGDMIYADNPCLATGAHGNRQRPGLQQPARRIDELRRNWRYNRSSTGLATLLGRTGYFAVWDDHEIENNFGPDERGGLFEVGRRVFREHNPIRTSDNGRLYRSVRWGANLEMFFLDLRSYRSPNTAADNGDKTMLGAEQKSWLLAGIAASDARHKIVVSSVPIAIPTGSAKTGFDSWVGFETELAEVFSKLAERDVRELTFITTDVHFATAHRFKPVAGAELVVNEIVVGPMAAGLFPNRELDPRFSPERLFFHGLEGRKPKSFDEAQRYMTFAVVTANATGLDVEVKDAVGNTIWRSILDNG